ncbi:MAG: response regulator [Pirellulaceae bacterium]|nr:response regulator [Pirellulaceae bacterium]
MAQKTVLIVDDSLMMRQLIGQTLAEDGWSVVGEACDGDEGVELHDRLRPDVVTMDLVMPGTNGLEALIRIKARDPAAKVVVVSAVNQTRLISEAIRQGACDFIAKPFRAEDLRETMRIVAAAIDERVGVYT